VIGEVASAMAIDKPFKCPLNLEPPSTSQEGVRQMKEHVAVDHTSAKPLIGARAPILRSGLWPWRNGPEIRRPRGLCHFQHIRCRRNRCRRCRTIRH
jgi:hypothetical protein